MDPVPDIECTLTDPEGHQQCQEALHALPVRVRQDAAMAQLGEDALAGVELPALMDKAVALVASTLEVEFAKILELLPDGGALLLRAGVGWREGLVGQATVGAAADSQAGYTLLSNEPVIVEDLRAETRFRGPALLLDHGVVSGLSVVIRGRERPFGVLGAHTTERRTFTKEDVHFLLAVANLLAMAIERTHTEELFKTFVHSSPIGIFIIQDRKFRFVNPQFQKDTGYSADELLGMDALAVVHPEDRPTVRENAVQMLKGQRSHPYEHRFVGKSGESRWGMAKVASINYGGRRACLGYYMDITERRQAQEWLKLLSAAVEEAPDGIHVIDRERRIIYSNKTMEDIVGFSPEEYQGKHIDEIDLDPELSYNVALPALWESGRWSGETEARHKDGHTIPVWVAVSLVKDDKGEILAAVAIIRDISERKRAEDEIRRLALHDPLTGVANRRLLYERFKMALAQARRSGQPLAVMSLDINGLKLVNDTFGHAAGDHLLCVVARALTKAVREVDTVTRIGGDEFLLLLPNADQADAQRIARRIHKALEAHVKFAGHRFHTTISIGISAYPDNGDNEESLLRAADDAMYRAKKWFRMEHQGPTLDGPQEEIPGLPNRRKRAPARSLPPG